jgi:hypothetical protein
VPFGLWNILRKYSKDQVIGDIFSIGVFELFFLLFNFGHENAESASDFAYEAPEDGKSDMGTDPDESALNPADGHWKSLLFDRLYIMPQSSSL